MKMDFGRRPMITCWVKCLMFCVQYRTKIFPSHRTGCSESVVNDSIIDALRTQKLLVLYPLRI